MHRIVMLCLAVLLFGIHIGFWIGMGGITFGVAAVPYNLYRRYLILSVITGLALGIVGVVQGVWAYRRRTRAAAAWRHG
jgi:hypothetical protein